MALFSSPRKMLIIAGGVLVAAGVLLAFVDKIPLFGKLPGDIILRRKNFTLYIPIVTSIIVSVLITILLNVLGRK